MALNLEGDTQYFLQYCTSFYLSQIVCILHCLDCIVIHVYHGVQRFITNIGAKRGFGTDITVFF